MNRGIYWASPVAEEGFWDSLGDQDAVDNTAGVPPYDVGLAAERLLRHMDGGEDRVLDLGCGQGRMMNYLAGLAEHIVFHGVDISARMLGVAAANSRHLSNTYYWHNNGRTLPEHVINQGFDFAYSIAMFQHIPADAMWNYIRQVHAALRPGGIFKFTIAVGDIDDFLNHQITDPGVLADGLMQFFYQVAVDVPDVNGWTWITAEKET